MIKIYCWEDIFAQRIHDLRLNVRACVHACVRACVHAEIKHPTGTVELVGPSFSFCQSSQLACLLFIRRGFFFDQERYVFFGSGEVKAAHVDGADDALAVRLAGAKKKAGE